VATSKISIHSYIKKDALKENEMQLIVYTITYLLCSTIFAISYFFVF